MRTSEIATSQLLSLVSISCAFTSLQCLASRIHCTSLRFQLICCPIITQWALVLITCAYLG